MRTISTLVLALIAGCASQPPPASQPSPLLGNVMPSFDAKNLSGNPVYSAAYYGHTLVMSFVDPQCAACEDALVAAQSAYESVDGVIVVGVFRGEDAVGATVLAKKHQLRFPIVVDRDGAIVKTFQIEQVPTTFVMDGQGRVRWVGGSEMTPDGLNRAVYAAQ